MFLRFFLVETNNFGLLFMRVQNITQISTASLHNDIIVRSQEDDT